MDLFSCCWVARDDTVVRALASHQCGLGFKYRRQCHMWVEFVVGSLLCSERFSSVFSVFFPLLKNQHFEMSIQRGIR